MTSLIVKLTRGMTKKAHGYLYQVGVATDQLFNALVGGFADETLSARAHRLERDHGNPAANLIDILFFWQDRHCLHSYIAEKNRRHMPPEYRDPKIWKEGV